MIASMRTLLRNGVFAVGLLVIASAAALSQAPRDTGEDPGMAIMSDTPQWCAHLAAVVAALRQTVTRPHHEADLLAHEGQRLCGAGHVRLGIMRLRYALMHLQQQ